MLRYCKIDNKGMSLAEILLACVLMACAFLPIIGIMTSSLNVTEKDANIQKAMLLCQEKLNQAIQLPYNKLAPGKYGLSGNVSYSSDNKVDPIILELGDSTINGVVYNSFLEVKYLPIKFTVPVCDLALKRKYSKPGEAVNWQFETKTFSVNDRIKQYTLTVSWKDNQKLGIVKSVVNGKVGYKQYSLSTFKADIR